MRCKNDGRALGIVKRSKKKATKKSAKLGRRGPGRPRKTATSATGLDAIVAQIRDTERERDRAMATLAKIRDLIDAAL